MDAQAMAEWTFAYPSLSSSLTPQARPRFRRPLIGGLGMICRLIVHLPARSADGQPWIDSSCQTPSTEKRNTVSRQAAETQRETFYRRSLRLCGLARNNDLKKPEFLP